MPRGDGICFIDNKKARRFRRAKDFRFYVFISGAKLTGRDAEIRVY